MKYLDDIGLEDVGKDVYVLFINTFSFPLTVFTGKVFDSMIIPDPRGNDVLAYKLQFPIKHYLDIDKKRYELITSNYMFVPSRGVKDKLMPRDECLSNIFYPQAGVIEVCFSKDELKSEIENYYTGKIEDKIDELKDLIDKKNSLNKDRYLESFIDSDVYRQKK